jgi:hypothetical protein
MLAPDGGNRMGGVTCDHFHAQVDNQPRKQLFFFLCDHFLYTSM